MSRKLILLTPLEGENLHRLIGELQGCANVVAARTLDDVERIVSSYPDATLLAFGTGVIVPANLLARLQRAYNVHAASPEYPGRDPHHHAVYRGATSYGATLHVMAPDVDSGEIIAVETFPLCGTESPADLLAAANAAARRLVRRIGPALLAETPPPPLPDVNWGTWKTTRADLIEHCKISPLIDREELDRRFRAFDGGAYDNLTVSIHNRTFRIDKSAPTDDTSPTAFADFTEAGFRSLIEELKKAGYIFARYGEERLEPHVLWRHDVDFSMHRAAALARLESAQGAVATYFVNPRSAFYNLLEPEVDVLLRDIADLGHEIGLHFDSGAYSTRAWTEASLVVAVERERHILETIVGRSVRSISWHNPDLANLLDFTSETVAGLTNAYSARLRRDYVYGSDSNGYWRFKPMQKLISEGHQKLHLLTHPEWWTPEAMAPSDRVDRALLGRARKVRKDYEAILREGGRLNVSAAPKGVA